MVQCFSLTFVFYTCVSEAGEVRSIRSCLCGCDAQQVLHSILAVVSIYETELKHVTTDTSGSLQH